MSVCVIFDLDGTLVDSVPTFTSILNAMLADRGAATRLTDRDVRPHATTGGLAMVKGLLDGACGDAERAIAEFRARYAALPTPPLSLYPGVRHGLARLADSGVPLGVWSNKPQALCEKVMDDLDLTRLLGAIVGTGPEVPLKPDLTGLDRALARMGESRAAAVFVGDSEVDHEAARRAGVPFVMVTYGYGDRARAYPGARLADSFDEAISIVMALIGLGAAADRPLPRAEVA